MTPERIQTLARRAAEIGLDCPISTTRSAYAVFVTEIFKVLVEEERKKP